MDFTYDVIVVGSGPAGASAAWKLAEAGVSVAVLERAELLRDKTCGGGVVGWPMQQLPVEVQQAVEQDCHTAELNVLPAGLSISTHRSTPIVFMTMRAQFDFAILSAARAAGAVVRQRCTAGRVSCHGDFVTIDTDGGSMCARFVIAADGALSRVANSMGVEDRSFGHLQRRALLCRIDRISHG